MVVSSVDRFSAAIDHKTVQRFTDLRK